MALALIRRFRCLNLANLPKCPTTTTTTTTNIAQRTMMTENEKEWIKQDSKKILEQVKNEKLFEIKIDLKQPQLYYEKSQELATADEVIKKLFSLEYARAEDFKRYEEELVKRIFRRSPIDENSLEIQIALGTITIRRMLRTWEGSNRRNNRQLFFLYRAIHRRDRLMVQLFHRDNKRYEWVKEKLNLTDYKLKDVREYKRETRYERHIREVKELQEGKRREKLNALKHEFDRRKESFFKEKQKILLDIQKELKELGFENLKFPPIENNKTV